MQMTAFTFGEMLDIIISLEAIMGAILEGEYYTPSEPQFWYNLAAVILVLIWAAIMSGLTVGLMSIDPMKFKLLKQVGSTRTKSHVSVLEPLLTNNHLLLATIVTSNCLASEILPLFMEEICPKWIGLILSLTLILMFGEILPQAICLSDPLYYGAKCVPLITIIKIMFYPIAKPVSLALQYMVGEGDQNILFRRRELLALLDMYLLNDNIESTTDHIYLPRSSRTQILQSTDESLLDFEIDSERVSLVKNEQVLKTQIKSTRVFHRDEIVIMQGALNLSTKKCGDLVKGLDEVVMFNGDDTLNHNIINIIKECGWSRIPIYHTERSNVTGILVVKNLIGISLNDDINLDDARIMNQDILMFSKDSPLVEALKEFQTRKSHLAFVLDDNHQIFGIITMEDVIECLMQGPI